VEIEESEDVKKFKLKGLTWSLERDNSAASEGLEWVGPVECMRVEKANRASDDGHQGKGTPAKLSRNDEADQDGEGEQEEEQAIRATPVHEGSKSGISGH
jgi:hypothetical protein